MNPMSRLLALCALSGSLACPGRSGPADVIATDRALVDAIADSDSAAVADASACADPAQAALLAAHLDLYVWQGEPAPTTTFAWNVPASCGTLRGSAPWLTVTGSGSQQTLTADPAALPTGLYTSALEFQSGSGSSLARATVRLRVLRPPTGAATRHVLIVGFDGTRPDALEQANTPVVDFLRRHSAYTLAASTQRSGPTMSAPGWMSAFTGVDTDHHRVIANGDYSMRDPRYRTFVARLADAGRHAVVATSWDEIITRIVEPGAAQSTMAATDAFSSRWLASQIRTGTADAYFEHLNDVDSAGHASGFSGTNPDYVRAIERSDTNTGTMLDAVLSRATVASEDWLFVLTTDHGGSGLGHGPMDAANQTIWFIAAGAGVRVGMLPAGETNHMDTAATVLAWLGVTIDPAWGLQGAPRGL